MPPSVPQREGATEMLRYMLDAIYTPSLDVKRCLWFCFWVVVSNPKFALEIVERRE